MRIIITARKHSWHLRLALPTRYSCSVLACDCIWDFYLPLTFRNRVPEYSYHLGTDFVLKITPVQSKLAGFCGRTMMCGSGALSIPNIHASARAPPDETNSLVPNDALSRRRGRETARHACQNCRRRKIKVCQRSKLCQASTFLT